VSHEFELSTRFLKIGKLDDLVAQWPTMIDVPTALHRTENDYAWLFAPGESIRGCSVSSERRRFGSTFRVRLSVAASIADWRIAYAFLRLAAARGAKVIALDEEDPSSQSFRLANETASRAFRGDVRILQRMMYEHSQDPITLPNFRFSLTLTREDLPAEELSDQQLERLQSDLGLRTRRYRGARLAATLTLQSGLTAVVWSGEALLSAPVDLLIFPEDPAKQHGTEFAYLPWNIAIERLGTIVELVNGQNPAFFFRELQFTTPADCDLWRSLREGARGISELSPK